MRNNVRREKRLVTSLARTITNVVVIDSEAQSPVSGAAIVLFGYLPKWVVEIAPEYKEEPPIYPYYTLVTDENGEAYMDVMFEVLHEPENYILSVSKGRKRNSRIVDICCPNRIVMML